MCRDHVICLCLDWKIILNFISEKEGVNILTGLKRLRRGSIGTEVTSCYPEAGTFLGGGDKLNNCKVPDEPL
jgi:hypothetical protein